ncbi:type II secretion system protein [Fusobacterium sp.]|uniref:PulJ/GspJ family protein n=1 Tax=Fusobacterium sp. TaxID=68766 RepID=UPI0025C6F323|nr:type II secretion system protein [Fusobacterium sp.]
MKSKNSGMTFLEVVISLGLLSIFSVLIFPTLKLSNNLNRKISERSLVERDVIRMLNIMERSIEKANTIKELYSGKNYVKNGVAIVQDNRIISFNITEEFLSKNSDEGNVIFLEIPRSNGTRIENTILLFQFIENRLIVTQGEIVNGVVKISNSDTLYENIEGRFKRKKRGVAIEYNIESKSLKEREEIKGYGNFNIF